MTMPTPKKKPARKAKKQTPASAKKPSAEPTPKEVKNNHRDIGVTEHLQIDWENITHIGYTSPIPTALEVATLASGFMQSCEMHVAVQHALDLLEYSAAEVDRLKGEGKKWLKVLKQFTYKAGIREITGQKRPERASSHFQDLLFAAAKINHAFANDDIRRQWVFDMITLHEKTGFTSERVDFYRFKFDQFKAGLMGSKSDKGSKSQLSPEEVAFICKKL